MRALVWGLTALLPTMAQADIVEFNFSGQLSPNSDPDAGGYQSFQVTFLANTLSPGNSLQYAFAGGCLSSVTANVAIYDVNVTVGGRGTMQGGAGVLSSGPAAGQAACGSFPGEPFGVEATEGHTSFSLGGEFDQFFNNNSESAILNAKDPLGLILDQSFYSGESTAGPVECAVPGLPPPGLLIPPMPGENCLAQGNAHSVPEPDVFGLFAAGGAGLLMLRRRRWDYARGLCGRLNACHDTYGASDAPFELPDHYLVDVCAQFETSHDLNGRGDRI